MNEEIERIQMTIEQAEAKVAKAEKTEQLLGSDLFKDIITEDYLGDDAVRITVNLKPGKAEDNATSFAMLEAKAIFSRFIANILSEGQMAAQSLAEHQELMNTVEAE